MVPKHKYKRKHPLQVAFKLQWTFGANPSKSWDYHKQNITGWDEFQPKCLIGFISKKEVKWGRGSCLPSIKQFWQPPVWAALVLLCSGARACRLAAACVQFRHSVISAQTHPNLALFYAFWAGMGGKEGKTSLSWPHINCDLLESSGLNTQRDSYFLQ